MNFAELKGKPAMHVTAFPSPNWNDRPAGSIIDTVILHYTGMKSGAEALSRLCDANAAVSAHYLIEEDGQLFQLVDDDKRAWHAGVSSWQGRSNINDCSIGIELVNPGHEFGYQDFPALQIVRLIELLVMLKRRHCIPNPRFLGHSDIAPLRKADPGERFPWQRLAANNIGVVCEKDTSDQKVMIKYGDDGPGVAMLNEQLAAVGYHGYDNGSFGAGTEQVVRSFQAHWRPKAANGIFDRGTAIALEDIARKISE